ncbi:MAG TPA: radical SAM protein [Anaerolineales bacterium]
MTSLFAPIRRLFDPIKPIPQGIYHYQSPLEDPRNYRLHLRIEEDGSGIMIVNASTVLHLNQTAAEYAYYFVKNTPAEKVTQLVSQRYSVDPAQAAKDYHNLTERILTLIEVPDLDPVTFLDFERKTPYARTILAPYRLDCALTYRLPKGADPEAAPKKRVDRELNTQEWISVLDKAWHAGIPHIVFTGGEPTLREDTLTLIAHAEHNGQVSGLLSDGLRLVEEAYLVDLLQTGLDHLMMVLEPENDLSWQALGKVLAADLFTAIHLTLTPQNAASLPGYIKKLAEMGTPAISLTSQDPSLGETLQALRDHAADLQMSLVWDLPVPYSSQNPIAMELVEEKLVDGAGRAWLYVEPDGDVLPAQGLNQILGNMLKDPFEKIWNR